MITKSPQQIGIEEAIALPPDTTLGLLFNPGQLDPIMLEGLRLAAWRSLGSTLPTPASGWPKGVTAEDQWRIETFCTWTGGEHADN